MATIDAKGSFKITPNYRDIVLKYQTGITEVLTLTLVGELFFTDTSITRILYYEQYTWSQRDQNNTRYL